MDNVLALQMLSVDLDAKICLSWASCNSATSCRSEVSSVQPVPTETIA